jgi:NlpC/P60 family
VRHIITITSVKKIIFILLFSFSYTFSYSDTPNPKETFLPEIFSGFQYYGYHFNNSDEKITKKYADYLGMAEIEIKRNIELYRYIDRWMGTPYQWGGCSMRGVDCSCFVQNLYDDVFGVNIKRTTFTQFYDKNISVFKTRGDYKMGDLLFFKTNISRETRNNAITHVGLYLGRGYFVQASSKGVNIANVNSGYWRNCFVAAGRVKEYYKKIGATITDDNTVAIEKPKASFEEKLGSDFEPIPYPEDLEELKSDYAKRLQVNPDNISFPEVFEFIDKYKYSPFSIVGNCSKTVKMNNCFLLSFYKEVMNVDIDSTNKGLLKPRDLGIVGAALKKNVCDIVAIKTDKNFTTPDIVGVYLYNDYFLHIHDSVVAITSIRNPVFDDAEIQYYRFYPEIIKKSQQYVIMKRRGVDTLYNILNDWEKPKVVEKTTESIRSEDPKENPKEEPEIETASDDEFSKKERKKKQKELARLKKQKEEEATLKALEDQEIKDVEERAKQEEIYNKKKADAARQKKIDEDKAAGEKMAKEKAEQEAAEKLKKQEEEAQKQAAVEEQKRQQEENAQQAEIEKQKAAKAENKKKKKSKKREEPVEETQPVEPAKNTIAEEVKPNTNEPLKGDNEEVAPETKKSKATLKKERKAQKKKEAELAAQKQEEERLAEEAEMKKKQVIAPEPSTQDSEIEVPTKTKAEIRKEKRKEKKAAKKRRKEEQLEE